VTARTIFLCAAALILLANGASAARYQKTQDGKTQVWNSLRGVAQEVTWTGLRDLNGYATGQGTLTWYRLGGVVNSYTGKMVRGKFEGPVIREQGNTRLQANFVNGEKASGWSEPGSAPAESASASPTRSVHASPTPNQKIEEAEKELTASPLPSPSPSPTEAFELPTPIATATFRPVPSPTPIQLPSPTPTPRILPSPSPTPTPRSTPTSTPTPIILRSPSPTPTPRWSPLPSPTSTAAPTVEPSGHARELATAAPQQSAVESPRNSPAPAPPVSGDRRKIDPVVKRQIIAEFQKEISFVLGEVKGATGNFHEVDRLDQVHALPSGASSHVTLLANQARLFRAQLGNEVTFYECLNEIQAVDSLVVLDEATRDIAAKDTPTARKNLGVFRSRYSEPTSEPQKPLWRYLMSVYSLCDRLKAEAEGHLTRAHSLELEGKRLEALREYQEISRIYPNAITTEKIRQLQSRTP